MKIQIFIPTFNRSEKLKKAVLSVLNQTWPDLQVVVLDNHSTDNTQQVIASLMTSDPRVTSVRRESNIGMIANFNSIGGLVTGDYFSVLADDDEYDPCFVDVAMTHFAKYPDISFVACNALTKVRGIVIKSQMDFWREGYYSANTAILKCLLGHYPLITNCLMKADVRGEFFFYPELGNVGDGFLLTILFSRHNAYVTKRITGYWNNDGENASSLQKYDSILLVNTAISEYRLYRELSRQGGLPSRWLPVVMAKRNLTILVASDHDGFDYVLANTNIVIAVSRTSIFALRILDWMKLVRVFIRGLKIIRQVYTRYIVGTRSRGVKDS